METPYRGIDNCSQIALDEIWKQLVKECILNSTSTGKTFESNYNTTSETGCPCFELYEKLINVT